MRRRTTLPLLGLPALPWLATAADARAAARDRAEPDTLRVAFPSEEAGFDPVQVGDATSIQLLSHIFEAPLGWDPLARPARLVPRTVVALPEVSDDFRHFVFTLRPGILFADDPAYGGRPRELVAADYVYSIKRFYDPKLKTEHLYQYENAKILGLSELRARALKDRTLFPYDVEVPGLRAIDRYRFELRLAQPAPRFVNTFASAVFAGALAREVVQRYGDDIMAHPVGTGPYRLHEWRRGSRIVLARNPVFRDVRYAATPADDDPQDQAVAKALSGRRLPMIGRIEAVIIPEVQPRWLAFLDGSLDALTMPAEFAPVAVPNGRLAPYLARRGVALRRTIEPDISHTFFNLDHPMVGGHAPPQVALRRAVAIAFDNAQQVRTILRGQGIPAHSMVSPHTRAYDPALRSELGSGDVARANALLDVYGYQRDSEGWRRKPDGSPLRLLRAHSPTQRQRAMVELWDRSMRAIGVRIGFEAMKFADLIKRSLAGDLMMWGYIWSAGSTDSDFFLGLAYGPNADQSNDARMRLPDYDRRYARLQTLGEGAERQQLERELTHLMLAHVPYLPHEHSISSALTQPHVVGYRRHPFARDWYTHTALTT